MGVMTLESLLMIFGYLKRQHKMCNLLYIACSSVYALLIHEFQRWQPLQNLHYGLKLMASRKNLLKGDQEQPFDCSDNAVITSPHAQLSNEINFSDVRISWMSTWESRDPELMF